MSCEIINVVKIRQGSKERVKVRLSDKESGERLDLTPFDAGKVIFFTSGGTKLEIALTIPPTTPELGVVEFVLDSATTAQFDKDMRDMEVVLEYSADANEEIFTLRNSIEVEERLGAF